jgi:hypothetical protein
VQKVTKKKDDDNKDQSEEGGGRVEIMTKTKTKGERNHEGWL